MWTERYAAQGRIVTRTDNFDKKRPKSLKPTFQNKTGTLSEKPGSWRERFSGRGVPGADSIGRTEETDGTCASFGPGRIESIVAPISDRVADRSKRWQSELEGEEETGQILAAIPAHNEAKTIGSIVLATKRYVDEVAVIDDGSTDGTAWIAQQAGATVIRHDVNRGYGAAIRSCFEYARLNGTEVLVILDGDGQHEPDHIPRVIEPVQKGKADVSIGSRFLDTESAAKVPRYRRFGIKVLTELTNLGTRVNAKVQDAQSGFRAYSRKAMDALDPKERDMGASTEILWDANKNGLKIVEVPIEVTYEGDGSSQGPIRHGLSVIASMLRYIETEHALLAFGVPGVTLFLIGIVLGVDVFNRYNASPEHELAEGLALLTVFFLMAGMMLSFTALILHAVINANRRTR